VRLRAADMLASINTLSKTPGLPNAQVEMISKMRVDLTRLGTALMDNYEAQLATADPSSAGAYLLAAETVRRHLSYYVLTVLILIGLAIGLSMIRCAARCNNEHDKPSGYEGER
jgi:hypothetical protein